MSVRVIRIDRADGGVSIMRLWPIGVVGPEGVFVAARLKSEDGDFKLVSEYGEVSVKALPDGWRLSFSDPENEFGKWVEDQKAMEAVEAAIAVRRGEDPPPTWLPATWAHIAEDDVPVDRTFRNAWIAGDRGIAVDMSKAREIHKERLRTKRKPLLAALDVEYQRADERGDAAAKHDIARRKQALRDVTADPAIANARTPEALAAVMPAGIK